MFGINKNGTKEKIGILLPATYPSSQCSYDNTSSGMTATDVQDAIDELCTDVSGKVSKSGDTMTGNLVIDRPSGSTAEKNSAIILGNSTPVGTVGNSYGNIRLYGSGSSYTDIFAKTSSANRNIHLPDATGTVALKEINNAFTENQGINRLDGTTSAVGTSQLTLGNSTAKGTVGNSKGRLNLWGERDKYASLMATNVTANRTFELPDASGTIALENGSVSVTGNGSKTHAQLLNSLYALIDSSKITVNAKIDFIGTIGTIFYYNASQYVFLVPYFDVTNGKSMNVSFNLKSSGSRYDQQNGDGVVVNHSNEVMPNGYKITVYY